MQRDTQALNQNKKGLNQKADAARLFATKFQCDYQKRKKRERE